MQKAFGKWEFYYLIIYNYGITVHYYSGIDYVTLCALLGAERRIACLVSSTYLICMLNIMPWNVHGIDILTKRVKCLDFALEMSRKLHSHKKHSSEHQTNWIQNKPNKLVTHSFATATSKWIFVILNKTLDSDIHKVGSDEEGRFRWMQSETINTKLCCILIYSPNVNILKYF